MEGKSVREGMDEVREKFLTVYMVSLFLVHWSVNKTHEMTTDDVLRRILIIY